MKKILFVCLGNICRSPTAHGVLDHVIREKHLNLQADSAGTANYHIGKMPDSRTLAAAEERGYDFSSQRARQVKVDDFYDFDFIFAMDHNHLAELTKLQPKDGTAKLGLYLEFAELSNSEVPDPYYGAEDGFQTVLDLCEQATHNIIKKILHD